MEEEGTRGWELRKKRKKTKIIPGTQPKARRVSPPDPRPEGRGPRRFFDFSGRELTFFRNSLQGEGREWEKETQCGKGLGSWDT